MRKIKALFFMILAFLWLVMIFSLSLQPAEVSTETSQGLIKSLVDTLLPWWSDELGSMPAEDVAVLDMLVRKAAHFVEFMILGVLVTLTMAYKEEVYRTRSGIMFCIVAAAMDETIQLFVQGRAGRLVDVVIDSVGAAVGVLIVVWTLQDRAESE